MKPTKQIDDVIDIAKQFHNLLQRNDDDKVTIFTWDSNVLSTSGMDGNFSYYLDDLGSPIRVVDRLGRKQEVKGYNEFGQETSRNQQYIQPFGFTGYQQDSIANTYFAQEREYQPERGGFIGEDIIKGNGMHTFTLNQYGYCWNNPINLIDVNGQSTTLTQADKNRLIQDQNLLTGDVGLWGSMKDNGCGVVSIYNTEVILGNQNITFNDIENEINANPILDFATGYGRITWHKSICS